MFGNRDDRRKKNYFVWFAKGKINGNMYLYIYIYYFYTLRKKGEEFKVMDKSVIWEVLKVKLYNFTFLNWNFFPSPLIWAKMKMWA